jgi:hypothetical protein
MVLSIRINRMHACTYLVEDRGLPQTPIFKDQKSSRNGITNFPDSRLLLHRSMAKQKRHALAVMRYPASLCKRRANIDSIQPGTQLLLLLMWDRIRNHNPR